TSDSGLCGCAASLHNTCTHNHPISFIALRFVRLVRMHNGTPYASVQCGGCGAIGARFLALDTVCLETGIVQRRFEVVLLRAELRQNRRLALGGLALAPLLRRLRTARNRLQL